MLMNVPQYRKPVNQRPVRLVRPTREIWTQETQKAQEFGHQKGSVIQWITGRGQGEEIHKS